jgi:hypothetical protein
MPLTLGLEAYVDMMGTKGMAAEEATTHHARIEAMKQRLPEFEAEAASVSSSASASSSSLMLFGAVDVGEGAYWWDYGQLHLYRVNNLKLVREDGG